MLLTPIVLKLRRWPNVWLGVFLGAALLPGQQQDSGVKVLDLTAPLPPSSAAPGSIRGGGGGIGGQQPRPLPFEVRIESVAPKVVTIYQKFTVEVVVRNVGPQPYYLPASRNEEAVHAKGQRGRRTFTISLSVPGVEGGSPRQRVGVATYGSETDPKSLLAVKPGESILIRFSTDLRDALRGPPDSKEELPLSVACTGWLLEDEGFLIKEFSQRILSKNEALITVLPR